MDIQQIIQVIKEHPNWTYKELAQKLGMNDKTLFRHVKKIKEETPHLLSQEWLNRSLRKPRPALGQSVTPNHPRATIPNLDEFERFLNENQGKKAKQLVAIWNITHDEKIEIRHIYKANKRLKELGRNKPKTFKNNVTNPKIPNLEEFKTFLENNPRRSQKDLASLWGNNITDRDIYKAIRKLRELYNFTYYK